MSFSANIKEELSKINSFSNIKIVQAEIYGYLLTMNLENTKIRFLTENEYNINRLNKLLNRLKIDYKIEIQGKNYAITFKKQDLDIENPNLGDIDELKAIVRGAFLGSGSVTEPKTRYHLEIRLETESSREKLIEILNKFNIEVKLLERKYSYSIYIKDRRRNIKIFSINWCEFIST
ncbi:MAG: DNA-binding protein WhiA [Clostridia bacterium]|nr:DNA-binding protein WhiA [Clostridia bacterium]